MYMDSYSDRRNRSRSKKRPRADEGGDVIITAITIQVIVCLILILVFVIYKKADSEGYGEFKSEYSSLVSDRERNGESVDALRGMVSAISEVFSAFGEYLSGVLDGFFNRGEALQPDIVTPDNTSSALQSVPDEPAQSNYNYLNDKNAFFTGSTLPAGGWNPVQPGGESGTLTAPEGSTLSPVILGGYMKPPVTGLVTSSFGYRSHPITQESDFHTGMDIAAVEGAKILAALPGEVMEVGEDSIYGKYIIIQHATNLKTFYAHCSQIIAEEGMVVRQGERIAKVGSTGMTTGPHLHFSIIVEEQFADPYWLLSDDMKLLEEA